MKYVRENRLDKEEQNEILTPHLTKNLKLIRNYFEELRAESIIYSVLGALLCMKLFSAE